ncbi:MAG: DMT family transporter [Geminicoccaceae bacterium]
MPSSAIPDAGARRRATVVGLGAIGLWALLAPLGVLIGSVPPFLLTGLAFAIGGLLGLAVLASRRQPLRLAFAADGKAWALGTGAFFFYHALYFTALQQLPPVEALLIINLWPLLIVLFSALLPGERLLPRHLVGALAGLAGTTLIVLGRAGGDGAGRTLLGYLCAVGCALIWSGYSVLNRRVAHAAASEAVIGYCLVTAVLALAVALLAEPFRLPQGTAWLAMLAMGLGPVGAAFFLWDFGTRHGDLRVLGSSAYAAPLLGSLLLVLLGYASPSLQLLAAAILIIGGAALASGDLFRRPAPPARTI